MPPETTHITATEKPIPLQDLSPKTLLQAIDWSLGNPGNLYPPNADVQLTSALNAYRVDWQTKADEENMRDNSPAKFELGPQISSHRIALRVSNELHIKAKGVMSGEAGTDKPTNFQEALEKAVVDFRPKEPAAIRIEYALKDSTKKIEQYLIIPHWGSVGGEIRKVRKAYEKNTRELHAFLKMTQAEVQKKIDEIVTRKDGALEDDFQIKAKNIPDPPEESLAGDLFWNPIVTNLVDDLHRGNHLTYEKLRDVLGKTGLDVIRLQRTTHITGPVRTIVSDLYSQSLKELKEDIFHSKTGECVKSYDTFKKLGFDTDMILPKDQAFIDAQDALMIILKDKGISDYKEATGNLAKLDIDIPAITSSDQSKAVVYSLLDQEVDRALGHLIMGGPDSFNKAVNDYTELGFDTRDYRSTPGVVQKLDDFLWTELEKGVLHVRSIELFRVELEKMELHMAFQKFVATSRASDKAQELIKNEATRSHRLGVEMRTRLISLGFPETLTIPE